MNRYYYDLHLHSCLSPCGDNDSTPANIAGMATLCGLNIVALTDHNTAKNCPAFFAAAKKYGLIPIAGMELTTSEDIHVVCLFEELEDALSFSDYVNGRRFLIENRPEIFGEQLILNEDDEIIGEEKHLLINATDISIDEAYSLVLKYNGVCYPAHIDKKANGLISVLGDIPPDSDYVFYELHSGESIAEFSERYGIPRERFIISSDAHYLSDMRDKEFYFELEDEPYSSTKVRSELFRRLRGK
jgi:DNA polymerase III alpha subunit